MFISHYATGLGFSMQQKGSRLTFFILVLGTQFVDVLWGLFTILGFEGGLSGGSVKHNYFDIPWSHSLLMMVVWSVVYGLGTQWYLLKSTPELTNFGILAGLSVFSHWLLDFIVHDDDMLILPTGSDSTVPSLHLWEFPEISFLVELLIIGGFWYYYWSNHGDEEFKASKKPFYLLGLLVFLHIVGYLPTFSDTGGTEAGVGEGFTVLFMLILIPAFMTWMQPEDSAK